MTRGDSTYYLPRVKLIIQFTNESLFMNYMLENIVYGLQQKVQIGQVTFSTSDLNDFYDPWVDQTNISCMSDIITGGSTSVIMQPITFGKERIIII